MQCPVCESKDYIRFVFVEHHDENGLVDFKNPSDIHNLFMCPMLHVFNEDGEIKCLEVV